jgi:hypothetical protein
MVDERRQVPAPSATGWLFDLTDARGPIFAVLRGSKAEARAALVIHLVDTGAVAELNDAAQLLVDARHDAVAVVW